MSDDAVFIATLGSEPQVVTIALHLLRTDGVIVDRVVVIHTDEANPLIARALVGLRAAFDAPPFAGTTLVLRPITVDGRPIYDISDEREAEATFRAIFRAVRAEKRTGRQVHFSIAGGRKVMSTYGMAAAQILFEEGDMLYHLISEGPLLKDRRMLPEPGDRVRLVPVPLLKWSADTALFADILKYDDPLEAMRHGAEVARRRQCERVHEFVRHVLTPAEAEAVALVVREGLTNPDVGARLYRSPKTVANQLSSAYAKLREYLGWPEERRVDRHTLITWMHDYYQAAASADGNIYP